MEMLAEIFKYLVAFVAGFAVKWVDWIDDEMGGKEKKKYILAIFYGISIGYLITIRSISELFLGALLAQVFARKIDTLAHMIGFFVAILVAGAIGIPTQDLSFLFFFFMLALLDELAGLRMTNFDEERLMLPIGAFAVAILFSRWEYFIAIALFDIGYLLFGFLSKRQKRR